MHFLKGERERLVCHLFISYIIYYFYYWLAMGVKRILEMCQQRAQQSLKFFSFFFFLIFFFVVHYIFFVCKILIF